MNQLLAEAFDRASKLPDLERQILARVLLNEIASGSERELVAPTASAIHLSAADAEQDDQSEPELKTAASKALSVCTYGVLATTDFAIQQFMRTRANERTVQPTKRRSYPPGTKRILFERQQHQCIICGTRKLLKNLQVDHIVPVVRGGPDSISRNPLNRAVLAWVVFNGAEKGSENCGLGLLASIQPLEFSPRLGCWRLCAALRPALSRSNAHYPDS